MRGWLHGLLEGLHLANEGLLLDLFVLYLNRMAPNKIGKNFLVFQIKPFSFSQLTSYLLHLFKCSRFHPFLCGAGVCMVQQVLLAAMLRGGVGGGGNGVLRTWEKLLTHGTHNVGLWKIHSNAPTA